MTLGVSVSYIGFTVTLLLNIWDLLTLTIHSLIAANSLISKRCGFQFGACNTDPTFDPFQVLFVFPIHMWRHGHVGAQTVRSKPGVLEIEIAPGQSLLWTFTPERILWLFV